jgi:DMSO/TMAO reductase YedYZ molybdopterin-dependent catalytic subunit
VEFIDLDLAPEDVLRQMGKDSRLIPYGGGNFGMPLDMIEPAESRIVPNDRFFMRSNGPVPIVDAGSWRLEVTGNVERPLSLSLEELQRFGSHQLEAFLECAGNSRTRFDPVPPGTPWRNDAIGNADWEGIPLSRVLDAAGVRAGAVDIVTQGADFPEMRRGLPLPVALGPDTLLVWGMNGQALPLAHGGPVRLLVPGWAGIASTKWLTGLEVINEPFAGFWNTDNYVFWDEAGVPLRPIAEMPPKSIIVSPADGSSLADEEITITGWAWSGYGAIERVELSFDHGGTWQDARLQSGERRGWRRWELVWQPNAGKHGVMARATDERRLRQPLDAPWNAKGYQMNGIHQISVTVGS